MSPRLTRRFAPAMVALMACCLGIELGRGFGPWVVFFALATALWIARDYSGGTR